jgi:hypothetical protein
MQSLRPLRAFRDEPGLVGDPQDRTFCVEWFSSRRWNPKASNAQLATASRSSVATPVPRAFGSTQ